MKKKITFEARVVDEDGVETIHKLAVRPPSPEVRSEGTMHEMAVFARCVDKGLLINEQLDVHLRNRKLWDDEKEKAFLELLVEKNKNEQILLKGGVKKSVARRAAVDLRGVIADLNSLLRDRTLTERKTAEAFAEVAKVEYFTAHCTTYDDGPNEGMPYFTIDGVHPSLEAYKSRETESDGYAAAKAFSDLWFGEVEDGVGEAFLKKYGFADSQGRLIDKDGRFVDEYGRPVDAEGYLLPEDAPSIDFVEFLDDDEDVEPAEASDDVENSEDADPA